MTSWRDSTSEAAQADLDGLLEAALDLAQQQLARHGELLPFGMSVANDNSSQLLAAAPSSGSGGQAQQLLDDLVAGVRTDAHERRAVVFVADVLAQGHDAIRLELEHRDGPALVVLVPYRRSRLRKTVTLKPMTAGPAEHRIWASGVSDPDSSTPA